MAGIRLALIVIACLVAVAVAAWLAHSTWRRSVESAQRRSLERSDALDVDLDAQAEESRTEVERAISRLRAGEDVDSVVIECWRQLQRLAAAAGVPRRPSETSEEFTVAVMSRTPAQPADLRQLAALYRRAMFGRAGDQPADWDAAIGCLERLAADLGGTRG